MPMSAKDPDKAAGDALRTNEHDEGMPEELNDLFEELYQVTPIDSRNPFDFGRFCQELDQNRDVTELAEKLESQALDQQRNNLTELAERFKAKGNQHFREKNDKEAIRVYTQGLELKCPDKKLNSILHSNRAAAFKQLGEFRLAFRDCVFALNLNITNYKAAFRGAECLIGLECARRCSELLFWVKVQHELCGIKSDDADFLAFQMKYDEFLEKASERILGEMRKTGILDSMNPNSDAVKRVLLAAFKERQYHFQPSFDLDDVKAFNLESIHVGPPFFPPMCEIRVHVGPKNSNLTWPAVLFIYRHPRAGEFYERVANCPEMLPLEQMFSQHFARPFSWDSERAYRPDNISYHMPLDGDDVCSPGKLKAVPSTMTLRDALAVPGHIIVRGVPVIHVLTKQQAEKLAKDS